MYEAFKDTSSSGQEAILKCEKSIEVLDEEFNFFEAPASLHHHGKEPGDLFKHSYQVTRNLLDLTEHLNLKWSRKASPYFVGMYHDLCKGTNYVLKHIPGAYADGKAIYYKDEWEYNNASMYVGHGSTSVILAQQLMAFLNGFLTEEEIACIYWHMGAFDNSDNWNNYGNTVTKYPNVLWSHTADMLAARVQQI